MDNLYGIVITVEHYKRLDTVKYAKSDGQLMKCLFMERFGISEDNMLILSEEDVLTSSLKEEVKYFLNGIPNNSNVYFYYAGHGFYYNGKNYLTTYETYNLTIEFLLQTSVAFEDLFVNPLKEKNIKSCLVFIDSCAELIKSNSRGIAVRGLDYNSIERVFEENKYNYFIYFSCSPDEKAYPSEEYEHGVWTWYLYQAFCDNEYGAYDKGPYISTDSLQVYLKRSMVSHRNKYPHEIPTKQTPYCISSSNSSITIYDNSVNKKDFVKECEYWVDELLFNCASVDIEKGLGNISKMDEISFPLAREICWDLQCEKYINDDWEDIFTTIQYYYQRIQEKREITISYEEQQEIIERIQEFVKSIPSYYNQCFD